MLFILRYWRWRPFVAFLAPFIGLVGLCDMALGQGQPKASPQGSPTAHVSPDSIVASMWQAIFTTCPLLPKEPGKTATFYGNFEGKGNLYELRDAKTKLVPQTLTEADRLNGIQFKGLAILGYSAYRYIDRRRQQVQWLPFNVGTKDISAATEDNAELFPMTVHVEKRNGQWSFESLYFGPYNLGTLARATIKKSCTELTSDNPFAADDDRARNQMEAARKQEEQKNEEKNAERGQLAGIERELKVERDLGNAVLCRGTKVRDSLVFDNSSILPTLPTDISVKIVGASDKGGVLGEWIRVKPLVNVRLYGLTEAYYFVPVSAVRDSCGLPNTQGLVSGSALAEGVRAAGSLDRWPLVHQQELARSSSALDAGAVTADEFTAKLADALKKRGPELGVNLSQYTTAIKTISDVVHLCSSISASEFAGSMDQYSIPHLFRYKEGKYKDCTETGIWRGVSEATGEPPVFLISFNLRDRWQREQKQWDGPKLHMTVYLNPAKDAGLSAAEIQSRNVILSVDVK